MGAAMRRQIVFCAAVATVLIGCSSSTYALTNQDVALIKDTAASICNTVKEAKGRKAETQVSADIKAEVNGLIGKLAGAGGSGAGNVTFSQEEYENYSRDAAAELAAGDRQCRERIFNKMFEKLSLSGGGAADGLDNTIGFQCAWSMPPHQYREDRQLSIVEFQNVTTKRVSDPNVQLAGPRRLVMGSQPFPSPETDHSTWYRCDLMNYGNKWMRDVRAKFPVAFRETVPESTGSRAGEFLAIGHALTPDLNVGVSPNNKDYFYFHSTSPAYVLVDYPTEAEVLVVGETTKRTVKLVPPTGVEKMLTFWPNTPDHVLSTNQSSSPSR
jgi:hypothetical protein